MKPLLLLGAVALVVSGCTGDPTKCADTGCDTGSAAAEVVAIQSIGAACDGYTCVWEVTATGSVGGVELDLVETGDPAFECGPSSTEKAVECGVWAEAHTAFTLVDFDSAADTETHAVHLDELDCEEDSACRDAQVNDESTVFGQAAIDATLTALFLVTDREGVYADCAVAGHDPGYFAHVCTDVTDDW